MITEASKHQLDDFQHAAEHNAPHNIFGRINADQQHKRLAAYYPQFDMKTVEGNAINIYGASGYRDVNEWLHTGGNSYTGSQKFHGNLSVAQVHAGLLSAVEKSGPTPEHIHVYSGLGRRGAAALYNSKPGDTFSSRSWTSGSIRPLQATGFVARHPVGKPGAEIPWQHMAKMKPLEDHIIHFSIPWGDHVGMYLGHQPSIGLPSEQEFIIRPKTRWQITERNTLKIRHDGRPLQRTIWSMTPVR